jgi:hypothetical protein
MLNLKALRETPIAPCASYAARQTRRKCIRDSGAVGCAVSAKTDHAVTWRRPMWRWGWRARHLASQRGHALRQICVETVPFRLPCCCRGSRCYVELSVKPCGPDGTYSFHPAQWVLLVWRKQIAAAGLGFRGCGSLSISFDLMFSIFVVLLAAAERCI